MILHEKFITKTDLDQIEKYADKLFAKVGIDVEFTRHFLDRVNDERNRKQTLMLEQQCVPTTSVSQPRLTFC